MNSNNVSKTIIEPNMNINPDSNNFLFSNEGFSNINKKS